MGARYLKKQNETLRAMYATATKAEILAAISNREWIPLCVHARKMGLHRLQATKGKQVWIDRRKAKEKEKKR